MWEAMHGEMAGYYEVRVRHGTRLYRLFCLLEREGPGLVGPTLVVWTNPSTPPSPRASMPGCVPWVRSTAIGCRGALSERVVDHERTGDNAASVAKGLERSGRIFTSAAIIVVVGGWPSRWPTW